MAYSDHEQALRVASALSAVMTGCCLRYGLFASFLRQPVATGSCSAAVCVSDGRHRDRSTLGGAPAVACRDVDGKRGAIALINQVGKRYEGKLTTKKWRGRDGRYRVFAIHPAVQQQINSALSRTYRIVIDALAELGAKELARRNAVKSAQGTLIADDTSSVLRGQ